MGHSWSKFGTGNRTTLTAAGREAKANGKLNETSLSNGNNFTTSKEPSPIPSRMPSPTPSGSSANSELDADGGSIGRETRRRLMEWWSKEYCASRMHLCVIGRGMPSFRARCLLFKRPSESPQYLANIVSRLFSPIPNRGQDPLPLIHEHPFGPNEMGVSHLFFSFSCGYSPTEHV